MAKVFKCEDMGMQCNFVARGQNDEAILQKAADHCKMVHDLEPSQELADRVRKAIREEK